MTRLRILLATFTVVLSTPRGERLTDLETWVGPGGVLDDFVLRSGYAIASSSLNVFGNNCQEVTAAETLMMIGSITKPMTATMAATDCGTMIVRWPACASAASSPPPRRRGGAGPPR
jgi:hypothetical protein